MQKVEKFLPLSRPMISKETIDEVIKVLESGWLATGPLTQKFEKALSNYYADRKSACFTSATAGLHASLMAIGVEPGDEVITTPLTFVCTANVIAMLGARPVFVDINRDTFNIDADRIEEACSDITKAIMPVHLYGQPADMDAIMDIAKRHNLYVIEDCCQAIGAEYKGKKVGSFGDIGCYSFFPTKNLGGMGDGGMAVTNSDYLKDRMIALRNHGGAVRYHHDEIGVNSRLDEIQSAILRVKMKYIDEWNKMRREVSHRYTELFKGCEDVQTPKELDNTYCVYHQYTIKVPHRDEVQKMLQENGVGAMLYYPIPLHMQKVHAHLGYKLGDLPHTEYDTQHVMSLPMFAELTLEEQKEIVEKVKDAIAKCKSAACC